MARTLRYNIRRHREESVEAEPVAVATVDDYQPAFLPEPDGTPLSDVQESESVILRFGYVPDGLMEKFESELATENLTIKDEGDGRYIISENGSGANIWQAASLLVGVAMALGVPIRSAWRWRVWLQRLRPW